MAFFGFDTTLPKDRSVANSRGLFEQRNQFADLQKAAKLNAFQDQEEEMYDQDSKLEVSMLTIYTDWISRTHTTVSAMDWRRLATTTTTRHLAEDSMPLVPVREWVEILTSTAAPLRYQVLLMRRR